MRVKDRHFELFITEADIRQRIIALAQRIDQDYPDEPPVLVAVLNGAFVFAADLVRAITVPSEITFVKVKSYEKMSSTGEHRSLLGLETDIAHRHVIIIEDIVDSGNTIRYLLNEFGRQQPKSIAVAALLFKPRALAYPLDVSYVGFEIPNDFVVGYGLDYDGFGRNLRAIYTLSESPAGEEHR